MKPVVAVLPLFDTEKNSIWMIPNYLDCIRSMGGIPLILPYHMSDEDIEEISHRVDGYLFTGGNDVDPALYHKENSGRCGAFDHNRDDLESRVYKTARRDDKPVLGICRGLQIINVLEGGTLIQDLPSMHESRTNHHQERPYDKPVHQNHILKGTPLWDVTGMESIPVNSLHHQAIDGLAPTLKPMAVSEDGLTEAIYMPSAKFLWAVQWHPEFMPEEKCQSKVIFKAFLDAMRKE